MKQQMQQTKKKTFQYTLNWRKQTEVVIAPLKSSDRLKCKHKVPDLSCPQQSPSKWWLNMSAMQQYGILISHPGCMAPGGPRPQQKHKQRPGPGWVASTAQINSLRAECWGSRQILQGERWRKDERAGSRRGEESQRMFLNPKDQGC